MILLFTKHLRTGLFAYSYNNYKYSVLLFSSSMVLPLHYKLQLQMPNVPDWTVRLFFSQDKHVELSAHVRPGKKKYPIRQCVPRRVSICFVYKARIGYFFFPSHEYPHGDVMIARLIMCECTVKTELV